MQTDHKTHQFQKSFHQISSNQQDLKRQGVKQGLNHAVASHRLACEYRYISSTRCFLYSCSCQVSQPLLASFPRPLGHAVSLPIPLIEYPPTALHPRLFVISTDLNLTAPSDMRDLGLLPFGAPLCPLIRWH